MNSKAGQLTAENAVSILTELETAFFDIPFENSAFQTKAFVVAGQLTPGRAYRTLGLGMLSKVRVVQAHMVNVERVAIKKERLSRKIRKAKPGGCKQRLLTLDLRELTQGDRWGEKLLNDALHDLNTMYTEFKKIPKYTREQFEAEERTHFTQKLGRDVSGIRGAAEALVNMREDLPEWDKLVKTAEVELHRREIAGA